MVRGSGLRAWEPALRLERTGLANSDLPGVRDTCEVYFIS